MKHIKRSKKLLSDSLNSIDIFEDPIHFNMQGNTALTSSLGGVLSIAIIIFLAIQAITQAIDMFNRAGPQIIQMNEYEDQPSKIYLNNTNNFVFAVAMARDNAPIDLTTNAVMSFTSTYAHYIRSTDGTQKKYKANIYWAPCTQANFPSTIFPETTFKTYSLGYAYCPTVIDFTDTATGVCPDMIKGSYPDCKTPPNFDVQGTFLSMDFEFVQFKLKSCTAADAAYIAGLHCTSENINTVFTSSELTLNIYYSNTLIDPVNYDTPNKTYLDTIYWNVDPSASTVADIYVDTETVQDYYDYFSTDNHENRTFYSIQKDSMRELSKFHSSSLLEFNIRRSSLNHITSRKYTKILDVISNIGGMSELFMIVGAFIAIGYARYKYQMILGNVLYDFEAITEEKKANTDHNNTLNNTMNKSTVPLSSVAPGILTESNSSVELTRIRPVMVPGRKAQMNESVKNYFEMQKERKRVLGYSEISYFKSLVKSMFCMKNSTDEIMAQKARKQVKNDLDIIQVIEKLKEIDKLKMLLLNSDQRKAFDFIEKPLFMKDKDKPVQAGSLNRIKGPDEAKAPEKQKYSDDYDSVSDYARLYIAYKALQNDSDIDNLRYNQRLLEMISEELRSMFARVDQIIGVNPDPMRFERAVEKIMRQREQDQDEM